MPGDEDAPPAEETPVFADEAPRGFWLDLAGAARMELRGPDKGLLSDNRVTGVIAGNNLELRCTDSFVARQVSKPYILEIFSRKASAMLGRQIRAAVVDLSAKPQGNPRMEQLMNFGKAHPDVVKIRNK
jgi:hypothetical protein